MKNVIRPSYDLYINGRWVPSSDGSTFKAINPANGEVLSVCAEATQDDVNAAVRAAQAAFPAWKNVSPRKRQAILLKIADIIDKNADTLALIETLDNGKPIRETKAVDIPAAADHFRYFAGVVRGEDGRASTLDDHTLSLVIHERRRPDHPVELPLPHGRLETGTGPGRRLYDHPQAIEHDVPQRPGTDAPPGRRPA